MHSKLLRPCLWLGLIGCFSIFGCRKDTIAPEAISRSVTVKEARQWVEEHPLAQVMTVDWAKAKQLEGQSGQVVGVSITSEDRLSLIRNSNTKAVLNSMIIGSADPQANGTNIADDQNPNFNPENPPSLFFVRDSLNQVNGFMVNFVPKMKDKENGTDGVWTGHLFQWNMKGDTILVMQYEKNALVKKYLAAPPKTASASTGFGRLAKVNTDNRIGSIWSWLGNILSAVWDALNNLAAILGIPGAVHTNPYWWYGRGSGDGVGGGPEPENIPPSYDPGGINSYFFYYNGTTHTSPVFTAADELIVTLQLNTYAEADYLSSRETVAEGLRAYLDDRGRTPASIIFAKFAVQSFLANPSATDQILAMLADTETLNAFEAAFLEYGDTEELRSGFPIFFQALFLSGVSESSVDAALSVLLFNSPFAGVASGLKSYVKTAYTLRQIAHPGESGVVSFWHAYQEVLHLGLTAAGMVPVAGEIFDVLDGGLYAINGQWTDAGISLLSTVPVGGLVPATARFVKIGNRIVSVLQNGVFKFPRRSLRPGLGLVVGDGMIAHHIIPLGKQNHALVQLAARAGYDMNNAAKNGKALNGALHTGSHTTYSNKVVDSMDDLMQNNPNMTPQQARAALESLAADIKNAFNGSPNTHIDNLTW